MNMKTKKQVGSVQSIWQYPVKSMNGIKIEKADITRGGILGDRAYALLDQSNNKVASAKFPKKWSKLFELSATLCLKFHWLKIKYYLVQVSMVF